MPCRAACSACRWPARDATITSSIRFTQKDYYALMGVFASTVRVERPTFAVDPRSRQRYMWAAAQLFDLAYSINLLGNEGTTFTDGAEKAVKWKAEMEGLESAGRPAKLAKYPQLIQSLEKYWNPPRRAGGTSHRRCSRRSQVPAGAQRQPRTRARGRVVPSSAVT